MQDGKWKVYCFEADPYTYRQSLTIYEALKSTGLAIEYKNAAVNSVNGYVKVNSSTIESQGSNILKSPPQWDKDWDHGFGYREEDISVMSIDFSLFLKNVATKDDFVVVKMDIEGAEFAVLQSLIDTSAYELIDHLYCEYHDRFFDDTEKYQSLRKYYEDFFGSRQGLVSNPWK